MTTLSYTIFITPDQLGDIDEYIKTKIYELKNKEIKDIGVIQEINSFTYNDNSMFCMNNGNIKCLVKINIKNYLPKVGMKLKTKVKKVSDIGYYLDEPIEIFVALKPNEKSPKIKEVVKVEITSVKYKTINSSNYIILAKRIN